MAKKDLTELAFVIDKSGSMTGLESDTVGAATTPCSRATERARARRSSRRYSSTTTRASCTIVCLSSRSGRFPSATTCPAAAPRFSTP